LKRWIERYNNKENIERINRKPSAKASYEYLKFLSNKSMTKDNKYYIITSKKN